MCIESQLYGSDRSDSQEPFVNAGPAKRATPSKPTSTRYESRRIKKADVMANRIYVLPGSPRTRRTEERPQDRSF